MEWDLERYQRQLGLVHQRRVMDLNVLLLGDGAVLPYLATNLALLGVGAGNGGIFFPADSPRVEPRHLAGQFFFTRADLGVDVARAATEHIYELNRAINARILNDAPLPRWDAIVVAGDAREFDLPANAPVIWADVTNFGLWIGATRPNLAQAFAPNALTPALASLCGALAAQEVLRVTRCIRATAIEKFWVTLNYALRQSSDAQPEMLVNGAHLIARKNNGAEHDPVFQLPLQLDHSLARAALETIAMEEPARAEFVEPVARLYYSPFLANRVEDGTIIEPPVELRMSNTSKIILGGVGGLGVWVAAILAATQIAGELILFDGDHRIETHNLNRQVLYDERVIGLPKVQAAARAVRALNPFLTTTEFLEEIQATTVITRADAMRDAQIAISAFDNFKARYVLAEWAALHNVPLVDGGTDAFDGGARLIAPEKNGCLYCWWEEERGRDAAQAMRADEAHLSCTDADAHAPVIGRALVTTTAAIASAQALFALLALIKPRAPIDHQIGYFGKENALEKCRLNRDACPRHARGACEHPREFWRALEDALLESE
jgi:molybdopterin/thiamine biosynthesis adenylyltransferase